MQGNVHLPGHWHNLNTLDRFKGLTLPGIDNTRNEYIQEHVSQIWTDIVSGAAEKQHALLWRFVAVSFAELKKYHFYYW